MNTRALAIAGLALAIAPMAPAQDKPMQTTLKTMGVEQKLGAQVPASAMVRRDDGKLVPFGELLGRRPIILMPIFYSCQGVCGKETDNLMQLLVRIQDKTAGKDYDVVFLSLHPKETPELALSKKNVALGIYDRPGSDKGFEFLTGTEKEVRQITDAVGFHYQYDEATNRVNHPGAMMVLTPNGQVSQYFYGAEYVEKQIRAAIDTAGHNKVGYKAEEQLLGCVMIDPVTGRRSLNIENTIRVISALFALCFFSWIGMMSYKYRQSPLAGGPTHSQGGPISGV